MSVGLQLFEYGRSGNPTRECLEQALAALENGKHGEWTTCDDKSDHTEQCDLISQRLRDNILIDCR